MSDRPVRTLFLGSGGFAVPVLEALIEHPLVELAGVVTAPPRPVGRRRQLQPTPVGLRAGRAGLSMLTPARLRDPAATAAVAALEPELLVLADYGQIVPAALLELPGHGALNLHPSLLPRHRGAAPVQAAILAGDEATGVSLMLMDEGLDSGPLIAQRRLLLRGDEIAAQLEERLAALAAELLRDELADWLTGRTEPRPQPLEGVTMTRPLRRADGLLDASRPAVALERQVRAYQPWPGSYLETAGGRLVVWRARPGDRSAAPAGLQPGALALAADGELALITAEGLLSLLEVQPAGGRRMSGADFARGHSGLLTLG